MIVITLIFTSIRLLFHRFEKIIDITDDNNLYLTLKSNLNNINSPVGTLIYKEFLDSIYTYRFVFKDIESTNNFLESNNKEDIIYYKIEGNNQNLILNFLLLLVIVVIFLQFHYKKKN